MDVDRLQVVLLGAGYGAESERTGFSPVLDPRLNSDLAANVGATRVSAGRSGEAEQPQRRAV